MSKHRILWLDFVKGLCIFMVVFYHAIYFSGTSRYYSSPSETILKYLFDILMMPCFFAVSGYLFKSVSNLKSYLLLIYKKVSSFVIPYVVFFILFSIYYAKGHLHISPVFNATHIFIKPDGDLWFLQMLLLIFIIVGFLNLCHLDINAQLLIFSIFLLLFLIVIAPRISHVHVLLQFFNIVFFLMGTLIRRYAYYIKKFNTILLALFVLSFILMRYTSFTYDAQFISLNTIIPKVLGVLMIFSLSMNLSPELQIFKYFTKCGRYTLIIYIAHFIPVVLCDEFLSKITNLFLLNSFIITIICWLISIMICYVSENIKIFNFIFYPRKYINKSIIKTRIGKYLLK